MPLNLAPATQCAFSIHENKGVFELLAALAHLERESKAAVIQALAGPPQTSWMFNRIGREGWDAANAATLVTELKSDRVKGALLEAGFARGDPEFVELFVTNFQRIAAGMRFG